MEKKKWSPENAISMMLKSSKNNWDQFDGNWRIMELLLLLNELYVIGQKVAFQLSLTAKLLTKVLELNVRLIRERAS